MAPAVLLLASVLNPCLSQAPYWLDEAPDKLSVSMLRREHRLAQKMLLEITQRFTYAESANIQACKQAKYLLRRKPWFPRKAKSIGAMEHDLTGIRFSTPSQSEESNQTVGFFSGRLYWMRMFVSRGGAGLKDLCSIPCYIPFFHYCCS